MTAGQQRRGFVKERNYYLNVFGLISVTPISHASEAGEALRGPYALNPGTSGSALSRSMARRSLALNWYFERPVTASAACRNG